MRCSMLSSAVGDVVKLSCSKALDGTLDSKSLNQLLLPSIGILSRSYSRANPKKRPLFCGIASEIILKLHDTDIFLGVSNISLSPSILISQE